MPITTTPSGGPQGEYSTYTPIYSTTITSGTPTSITLSNIPTTYTDLVLVASFAGYYASNDRSQLGVRLNGDSGTNYSYTYVRGNGTAATSGRDGSTITQFSVATFPLGPSSSLQKNSIIMQFMNYSNNSTYKTILARTSAVNSDNNTPYTDAQVLLWRNTAPITTITLKDLGELYYFYPGTNITLYGIKAAATQFIPTKAAGGDIVVSDGTYAYHAFLSSGSFKPAQSLSCDVLVVAGGGSGAGNDIGGGGGAGGLRYFSSQSLTATTYAVTVGAGGAGAANNGSNGNDSQFGSLTLSTGGGKGGGTSGSVAGSAGGSGGGGGEASYVTGAGGAASPSGQGNAGGSATGNAAGGGGGGAGAAGQASNAGCGGGAGVNTYSSWATATGTGSGGYYAGGGGGGNYNANSPGSGGLGGGGTGSYRGNGSPAAAYTGSGGGGSGGGGVFSGGSGGSGIVIVRYAV